MRIRVNEIVLVCVCLHVFKPASLSLCMLLDRSAYVCYICQCIYACCLVCVCVCVCVVCCVLRVYVCVRVSTIKSGSTYGIVLVNLMYGQTPLTSCGLTR